MPHNLILNAHAAALTSPPQFIGGNNPPPFNQPIGQNNMSITVPANIELLFYTDIYELKSSCSGELLVNVKNPGKVCYGRGQHENYPALTFDENFPPKRIIQGGGVVPNMALWSDHNGYFYSGLSICQQKGPILNIDGLSDRWNDGGYPFKILLSEVLNYLNQHILHDPDSTDKFYIHLLMCSGGVEGVDTQGNHTLGNSDIGDLTYGMRALGTHSSFGGKKKRKTRKGKKRKTGKSKKRNNKKKKGKSKRRRN